MGLHQNLKDIIQVIYNDETLLRLLYYSPANLVNNVPDPLSSSLPNIMDMDIGQQWDIRNERIVFSGKTSDLTPDKPMSRLYVFAGNRKADGNYLMANQELIIDIFCHNDIENGDFRSSRIIDRLNQLFVDERVTGIGKMNYYRGFPYSAPTEYICYRHIFEFGDLRK